MALSNTATPKYYGMFRDAVIRGEIPVCEQISMEMNRIDALIANPGIWYDDQAIQGFVKRFKPFAMNSFQLIKNSLTIWGQGENHFPDIDGGFLFTDQFFFQQF